MKSASCQAYVFSFLCLVCTFSCIGKSFESSANISEVDGGTDAVQFPTPIGNDNDSAIPDSNNISADSSIDIKVESEDSKREDANYYDVSREDDSKSPENKDSSIDDSSIENTTDSDIDSGNDTIDASNEDSSIVGWGGSSQSEESFLVCETARVYLNCNECKKLCLFNCEDSCNEDYCKCKLWDSNCGFKNLTTFNCMVKYCPEKC